MSVNSKMTALMDAIRSKAGISGLLSLDTAKTAVDSIQTGITPSGTLPITENGTYDVTEYASANVNVSGGGAEITDGIIVKARDASGYATEVDFYASSGRIEQWQFGTDGSYAAFNKLRIFNAKSTITYIGKWAFRGSQIISISLPDVVSGGDGYFFQNCSQLQSAFLPKLTKISLGWFDYGAIFRGCSALHTVQIGSVGNTVTEMNANILFGANNAGLEFTVYTNGSYVDTFLTNIRKYGTNATIIIKASENTTYGGNSYLAGETILTSTP